MDVSIDEVVTDIVVSDSSPSLSQAEMRHIVQTVMEHMRRHQDCERQRRKDTSVRDRVYDPGESEGGDG